MAFYFGASDLTRTGDLLITSEMHYRLCYTSIYRKLPSLDIISVIDRNVNCFLETHLCEKKRKKTLDKSQQME